MRHFLDFEKPIAELESKIDELRKMSETDGINIADEVARLTEKADRQLRATYAKLTPWQKTQVARHPERPKADDCLAALITDYTPLAGDRAFADDAAVVGGPRLRRRRRGGRRPRPVSRPLGGGAGHREGHGHRYQGGA
jgi:acetyl-CoA carboxylase carboxyl transferase subunit alpha